MGSALIIFPFRTPEWPKPTRGTMTHGLPLSCLITLLITLHPRSGPTPAGPGPPHPGLCMRRGSLPYIRMRWSQIFAPSVPPSSDSLSSSLKATQKLPWCSGLKWELMVGKNTLWLVYYFNYQWNQSRFLLSWFISIWLYYTLFFKYVIS